MRGSTSHRLPVVRVLEKPLRASPLHRPSQPLHRSTRVEFLEKLSATVTFPRKSMSSSNSFHDLKLLPQLVHAVEAEGYTTPTPIQQQAIPHLLEGRDLVGCARTGTGKTAAFAL